MIMRNNIIDNHSYSLKEIRALSKELYIERNYGLKKENYLSGPNRMLSKFNVMYQQKHLASE